MNHASGMHPPSRDTEVHGRCFLRKDFFLAFDGKMSLGLPCGYFNIAMEVIEI